MYAYSLYHSYTQTTPTRHETSDWSEFTLAMIDLVAPRPATEWVKKHRTPAISPAIYAGGETRRNENVKGWGGWCALDVDNDLAYLSVEDAVSYLTALNLNHIVYTSTMSRPDHHRYRVVLPLSRWVEPEEAQAVWKAVVQALGTLGADAACKDISRIYGAPSHWIAAEDGNATPYNVVEVKIDGDALDVEAVLSAYIAPPEPAFTHVAPTEAPTQRLKPRRLKRLPTGHTLSNSPIVAGYFVDDYLALVPGEFNAGLFKFMNRIIGRASSKGYDVTQADVYQYCREVDALSPHKRSPERWKQLQREIANAFLHCGKF